MSSMLIRYGDCRNSSQDFSDNSLSFSSRKVFEFSSIDYYASRYIIVSLIRPTFVFKKLFRSSIGKLFRVSRNFNDSVVIDGQSITLRFFSD